MRHATPPGHPPTTNPISAPEKLRRFDYRALAAFYRALFPSDAPPTPLDPAAVRRLLLVRHDAIGDMVVTLPAIAYLRALLPHADVDVLASPRNASLLDGDARVSHVYVNDHRSTTWPRIVRTLRRRHYDLILSPIGSRGLREGLFAAAVADRHTVRASLPRRAQYVALFTHYAPPVDRSEPIAARMLTFVAEFIRRPPSVPPPRLERWPADVRRDRDADARVGAFLDTLGPGPIIALNAWASDDRRTLGTPLTIALARGLLAPRAGQAPPTVVLTPPPDAGADAAAVVAAVREADGAASAIAAAPRGPIADLVALLRRASLVVTPDTANSHLASAVGVPVVSLYTPLTADVREWRPWGVPYRAVVMTEPRPLREVSLPEVLAAIASLRDELRTHPPRDDG